MLLFHECGWKNQNEMAKVEPRLELTTLKEIQGVCHWLKLHLVLIDISIWRKFWLITVSDTSPSGLGEKSTQVNK